jgi:hypothetical protein
MKFSDDCAAFPPRLRARNRARLPAIRSAAAATCLASALAIAPVAACAEIFRWVDENGRVQFGDRPPADAQAEQVEIGADKSVSGDLDERQQRRDRLLDAMEEKRAEDARAEAESARVEATRRRNCATATETARKIDEARVIYEPTGDPLNPRVLDDAERAAAAERARQDVARWCR